MHEDRAHVRQQFEDMVRDYLPAETPSKGVENRFDAFLPFVSFCIFLSVLLGLHTCLPGDHTSRQILVFFVPVAIGGLSYIANKAAFHYGAKLAASGDRFAIALMLIWFLLMSSVVGTISFAGVSYELVEAAKAREPVQYMIDAKRRVSEAAETAKRVLPLISSGEADIAGIKSCEARVGCVSGRSGQGRMVARLDSLSGRFKIVEAAYSKAESTRKKSVKEFEDLIAKYEAVLNESGGIGPHRAKLVEIYSKAESLVTQLANSVPTSTTKALISELRSTETPQPLPGRINVGARLLGHAERLEEALDDIAPITVALPPFPPPSGLTVGWERLDLTAPLAVVLFGLEAILILLWCLLVRDFMAGRRAASYAMPARGDHEDRPTTATTRPRRA